MKYHLNERNAMKRQKKMDFRCSGENHCSKLLFPYIDPKLVVEDKRENYNGLRALIEKPAALIAII